MRARDVHPGDDDGAPCLLTSGDIARLLDIDLKTVHNWVRLQHLAGFRTHGGHLRFHRAEVVRFMRRFRFPVPRRLGGGVARVALVGARLASARRTVVGGKTTEPFPRLFDAALALADGSFDLLIVDLDEVGLQRAVELVGALRRHALTGALTVVGSSVEPELREAFIVHGGDAVIASPAWVDRVEDFFLGG